MKHCSRVMPAAALALALLALSTAAWTQLPASKDAPKVGQKAPDFTLPDSTGKPVKLSALLAGEGGAKSGWLLLAFYRGYW